MKSENLWKKENNMFYVSNENCHIFNLCVKIYICDYNVVLTKKSTTMLQYDIYRFILRF
jgi:hypothetical protein